jgi:hypothetical protein
MLSDFITPIVQVPCPDISDGWRRSRHGRHLQCFFGIGIAIGIGIDNVGIARIVNLMTIEHYELSHSGGHEE